MIQNDCVGLMTDSYGAAHHDHIFIGIAEAFNSNSAGSDHPPILNLESD
jgi:hypothetical protein